MKMDLLTRTQQNLAPLQPLQAARRLATVLLSPFPMRNAQEALPEHCFDVMAASWGLTQGHDMPPSISAVRYLQSEVLSSGFGITDPVLRSKYGAKCITAQWVSLSKSMT